MTDEQKDAGTYQRMCNDCGCEVKPQLEEGLGGGQFVTIGCCCTETRKSFDEWEGWEDD